MTKKKLINLFYTLYHCPKCGLHYVLKQGVVTALTNPKHIKHNLGKIIENTCVSCDIIRTRTPGCSG